MRIEKHVCRHCASSLEHQVIDLGHQPPSNAYLTAQQLTEPELTYPLKLFVCTRCWLVQLPAHASADELFTPNYAYFSSTSRSWCDHAERFVSEAVNRLNLDSQSFVVEVASNDGYLLNYVQKKKIPCLGIEPTHATAEASRGKGINTLESFFTLELAEQLESADLVVANNVLAHVPDINDFIAGLAFILKPNGLISIEFPHLLRLLEGNQFDTIYHEHYSYLSLQVVQRIAATAGLEVVDVQELSTHGGSLRLWLAHKESIHTVSLAVHELLTKEKQMGLESLEVWSTFQSCAEAVKNNLLTFLLKERNHRRVVLGYGAAAKGNTLLNYAGIRSDLLNAVADLAPSKQGLHLPGSHIPIISPEEFIHINPDSILILPWNLAQEIQHQLKSSKQIVTAIPELKFH